MNNVVHEQRLQATPVHGAGVAHGQRLLHGQHGAGVVHGQALFMNRRCSWTGVVNGHEQRQMLFMVQAPAGVHGAGVVHVQVVVHGTMQALFMEHHGADVVNGQALFMVQRHGSMNNACSWSRCCSWCRRCS